MAGDKIKLVSF